jgi:cobalt-zinc-cadmium efflux system outer membrane protein
LAAVAPATVSATAPSEHVLSLPQAFAIARELRAERRVAQARLDAARQRPAIVSSLDDPIIAPSIDHKPIDPMMKTDRSITFEQSFPLSSIRSHRRRAAEADVEKYQAEAGKSALKIEAEVAQAFFMLNERRKIVQTVAPQIALAEKLVKLAASRHAIGAALQADVLRLEIEEARLRNRLALLNADGRAAEAMLNTTLGRAANTPVGTLLLDGVFEHMARLPEFAAALETALIKRAELGVSQAEIARAKAEIDVMKAMYAPMAMVRVGMAETMTAGRGYMLMVGVSVPIWFGRLRAGVREAGAMASMAEADREAMLRMIHGEVAAALESLRGAAANYQAFQTDLLPRAERAVNPALAAYASGALPLSSVLETSKALWSVQEEAVMAEASFALAWVRYQTAIGYFGEIK